MKIVLVVTAAMAFTIPGLALAAKMPAGAVPLTPDEVKALYADHTAVWKPSSAYFGADGSTKGVSKDGWVFWGVQSVNGNEMCMTNQAMNSKTRKSDGKKATDCWKWVKAKDGKLWTLYTKSWDNKKQDLVGGWGTDEAKNLKPGNLIGDKYKALGGP